jgi:hypothetical protein
VNILEDEMNEFQKETKFLRKRSTLGLLLLWLVIAITDLLLNYALIRHFRSTGLVDTKIYVFYFCFLFMIVPAACLLVSLLLALIPFKKLRYTKKYPSITVLLMVIVQAFLLGISIHNYYKFFGK